MTLFANWGGNVVYGARRVLRPSTVAEVQRLTAASRRIRALGTRHSFSGVADTSGDLVDTSALPAAVVVDADRATATVGAGMRYAEVCRALREQGWGLPVLASLPHISVAGACATGTHGSGDRCGSLAASVCGLEMVTADGDLAHVSRAADGGEFDGLVVTLGAIGIVTAVTLDVVPTFAMCQYVYERMPLAQLSDRLDDVFGAAHSVSVFTTWRDPEVVDQVWVKRRVDGAETAEVEPTWLGATLADGERHPVPGMPARHCTAQQGAPGPWDERLPHFRSDAVPSSGAELQSEYLVPRSRAVEALHALQRVRDTFHPVLQVSEIRSVAADELWLSPSSGRDSIAFHFTWTHDPQRVLPALSAVEAVLVALRGRPHWGKLFTVEPAAVASLYPRLGEARRLMSRWDPTGKFANAFVERYVLDAGHTLPQTSTDGITLGKRTGENL